MRPNASPHDQWAIEGTPSSDDLDWWDGTCDDCGATFDADEIDCIIEKTEDADECGRSVHYQAICGACNSGVTRAEFLADLQQEYEVWKEAAEFAGSQADGKGVSA